jgi:hypothetical protein
MEILPILGGFGRLKTKPILWKGKSKKGKGFNIDYLLLTIISAFTP